jgi:hypothetical protein
MRSTALLVLSSLTQDASPKEYSVTPLAVHGLRQDVAVYDFDGDGRLDLLVTTVDQAAEPPVRWALFYLQREGGRFEPKPDRCLPIPDAAAALIFGDFDDRAGVDLGYFASDGFYLFSWEARRPVKLIHTAVFFDSSSLLSLPVWQWKNDLDGNGLDDLILPTPTGYKVYFQTDKGRFWRIQLLEPEKLEAMRRAVRVQSRVLQDRFRATALRYEKFVPRLEIVDINADGRKDLVSITRDLLTVFFMTAEGSYDLRSRVRCVVPALSDKEEEGSVELSGIHFADLNGDRYPELIITKVEGKLGLVDSLQTNIYIHRGNGEASFTSDQSLYIPGLSLFPTFIDMDADGRLDLYATYVSTGVIQKLLEAKILGDLEISTGFWRQSENGFKEMDYRHDILIKSEVLEKRSGVPLLYVAGDFNGDGRPDLTIVQKDRPIGVHMGRKHFKGSSVLLGFEANPSLTIPIQDPPDYLQFHDLNGDGAPDLLGLYKSGVTLAISRR